VISYQLIVRPNAELQAAEAYKWYEEKLAGLGGEFLLSLDASINSVERNKQKYNKITL
jgi:hypothetical protein